MNLFDLFRSLWTGFFDIFHVISSEEDTDESYGN